MIRHVLLIANPASRRGRPLAARAVHAFAARQVECDLAFTTHPGHAGELAAAAAATHDAVFTLGGDGTAMEVAGALAGTGCRVGVLAAGTGNLLARALGIPLNVPRAVAALVDGDVLLIDLGRFEDGRCFAIVAGIGIDAAMVRETPSWMKRRLGVLAYVLMGTRAAVRAVWRRDFIRARVTVDGVARDYHAAAVMVANFGAILSDRITLGEGIRADDGFLDVCVFTPSSMFDAIRIMWRLLRRDFSANDAMSYQRGCAIRVEADPPVPAQADGELMGDTPFSVTVVPRCVQLLVPRAKPRA